MAQKFRFGWFVVCLVAAAGSLSACGSGGNGGGSGTAGAGGGSGQTPPPTQSCQTGSSCTCDDGREGKTVCKADVASCSCASCRDFSPVAASAFDACGGEPFGTWRATQVALDATTHITVYTPAVDCPIGLTKVASQPDFRLDLQSGGLAAVSRASYALDFEVLASCADVSKFACLAAQADCDCTAFDCNVTACIASVSPSSDQTASWTRTGSTINIDSEKYDYCVAGDTMTVHHIAAGLTYTMDRVLFGGIPSACEGRNAADCALGTGCHPLCAGGASCTSASTESSCTNRAGCTWDPTQCSGTPASSCALKDYDVVPGCKVYGPSATCTGTALPCAGKIKTVCTDTQGCTFGAGCTGGALSCADSTNCNGCNAAPGCSCDSNGSCLGQSTASCADMPNQGTCTDWGKTDALCHWQSATCNGKVTSCEKLSVAECASTEGCTIQAM